MPQGPKEEPDGQVGRGLGDCIRGVGEGDAPLETGLGVDLIIACSVMADMLAALGEVLNELVVKISGDLFCSLLRIARLIFSENKDIAYRATG